MATNNATNTSNPITIAQGGSGAASFTQSNGIVTYNGTTLVNYAGPQIASTGIQTNSSQPAFLAYLATSDTNATGNGGSYTLGGGHALTKAFDQGTNFNTNGTFTAPVTGNYRFSASIAVTNCTIATTFTMSLVTTARGYFNYFVRAAGAGNQTLTINTLANMTAADTAMVKIIVSGETGNTDTILGDASNPASFFSGELIC